MPRQKPESDNLPARFLAGAEDEEVIAYIDGGARGNPGQAGYGVHVVDARGNTIRDLYGYLGVQTNNCAEYLALLAALKYALKSNIRRLKVLSDSELLVRQIIGSYSVHDPDLRRLHRQAKQLIKRLQRFSIEHVPRAQNKVADKLVNIAIDTQGLQR